MAQRVELVCDKPKCTTPTDKVKTYTISCTNDNGENGMTPMQVDLCVNDAAPIVKVLEWAKPLDLRHSRGTNPERLRTLFVDE